MLQSLYVIAFLLLSCVCATKVQSIDDSIKLPDWMAQYSYLFNQSINRLTFPGSHDSGSYHLSDDIGILNTGDPIVNALIELADKLKLPVWEVLMPWSITQGNITSPSITLSTQRISHSSKRPRRNSLKQLYRQSASYSTLYNQAMSGMRYFDLRLAYVQDDLSADGSIKRSVKSITKPSDEENVGTWRIQHGLLGVDIRSCLTDLSNFLLNHKGEFLIIEMGHVEFVNQSSEVTGAESNNPAYSQLITMIQSILGQWLVPCDQITNQTVSQLIQSNQRVLIAVDPQILASSIAQPTGPINICDTSQVLYNTYADTPDVSDMIDYNNKLIAQFNKQFTEPLSNETTRFSHEYTQSDTKSATKWSKQSTGQPLHQSTNPLWKISHILTPDVDTILESIIPGFPHSLLELSDQANKKLNSFIQSVNQQGLQVGNILLIDDAVNTLVVSSVISNLVMRYNRTSE